MSIKVLSIGSDRKLFEEGSAVSERIKEYGALVEELHIIVFAKKSLGLRQKKIAPNIWIYPTNSLSRWLYPLDAIEIGKNIKASLITTQDPFESGWVGLKLKKILRIPLEVQLHTDPHSPYFTGFLNTIRKIIARTVLAQADGVRNVQELPIYVDRKRIDGESKFDLHEKYGFKTVLLMVTRLAPEKNIDMALEVIKIVRKKYPGAGLVIVGSGSTKFEPQDNVIFEGWQEDLTSYYKTADIFLQTSKYEGYGLSLVEAGLSGLHVISTPVGIAAKLRNVVTVNTIEKMSQAIELLIDAPKTSKLKLELEEKVLSKEVYLEKIKENWEKLIRK